MLSDHAVPIGAINENDLILWMKMPVKQVAEVRIHREAERTSGLGQDMLEFCFHPLKLYIICIIYSIYSHKYQYYSNNDQNRICFQTDTLLILR